MPEINTQGRPLMKEENANMDGQAPPPRRSPRDYRPDLRPMLILGGLLLAVIVGWILVSPLMLPSPR